jgi:hypothetical protein
MFVSIAAAVPLLVTVTVSAPVVAPVTVEGNVSVPGDNVSCGLPSGTVTSPPHPSAASSIPATQTPSHAFSAEGPK